MPDQYRKDEPSGGADTLHAVWKQSLEHAVYLAFELSELREAQEKKLADAGIQADDGPIPPLIVDSQDADDDDDADENEIGFTEAGAEIRGEG